MKIFLYEGSNLLKEWTLDTEVFPAPSALPEEVKIAVIDAQFGIADGGGYLVNFHRRDAGTYIWHVHHHGDQHTMLRLCSYPYQWVPR